MPFGKYRGKQMGWILENDTGYIVWLKNAPRLHPNFKNFIDKFYKENEPFIEEHLMEVERERMCDATEVDIY